MRKKAGDLPHPKSSARLEGLAMIQSVLSKGGTPVLGLYIYSASSHVLQSIKKKRAYRKIKPNLIGAPSVLSLRPGISQTELAAYLGVERATAGLMILRCIRLGWVRRVVAMADRRKYTLHITPAGRRMLSNITSIIASHEAELGSKLTADERVLLQGLLTKFISNLGG